MTWDYRVMRRVTKVNGKRDVSFGIYEIFFDEKGKLEGWTEDSVEPHGDTLKDLKTDLKWMTQAFNKPILDYNKLDRQFKRRKFKPADKKEECVTLEEVFGKEFLNELKGKK